MQDAVQSLDEVEERQVKCIEDSQPDLETQSQDLETALKRTDLDTPIRDSSKEVGTSSLNDCTPPYYVEGLECHLNILCKTL